MSQQIPVLQLLAFYINQSESCLHLSVTTWVEIHTETLHKIHIIFLQDHFLAQLEGHLDNVINLTPNYIINRTECKYLYQTSFHNITSNNTSSVLRENVMLTNTHLLAPKYGEKFGAIREGEVRGKGTLGGTPSRIC